MNKEEKRRDNLQQLVKLMELAQQYRKICKTNGLDSEPKYLQRFEYFTKVAFLAKKATTLQEEAEDGLVPSLDQLYESIIEQSKLAETHPTIENKEEYQKDLENFIDAYKEASEEDQKIWKKAFEESEKEHTRITASLEAAKATRARVNRFPTAQVFYVIKGEDADGRKWGRIDHVGQNYTMNRPKLTPNPLPLIVCYYRYEGGKYILEERTNSFKSDFDKQLLDVFRKTGKVSYEQYKGYDVQNRDYEYDVKTAGIGKSDTWTVFTYQPDNPVYTPKTIEVPDWDDFGFERLFYTYIDDCGAHVLDEFKAEALIVKMKETLEKQAEHIKELEDFHINKNDGDKDTEILIEVWKNKRLALETKMKTELPDPGSCLKVKTPKGTPVTIDNLIEKFNKFCDKGLLPPSATNFLLDEIKRLLTQEAGEIVRLNQEKEDFINDCKSKGISLESKSVKESISNYDKEILLLEESHTKNLEKEAIVITKSSKGECYDPINIAADFGGNTNELTKKSRKKIDPKLNEVAEVMKAFPSITLTIIGFHGAGLNAPRSNDMEVDDIPSYDPKHKDSIHGIKTTSGDIAMLRAESIKKILIAKGVNAANIKCDVGADKIPTRATLELK